MISASRFFHFLTFLASYACRFMFVFVVELIYFSFFLFILRMQTSHCVCMYVCMYVCVCVFVRERETRKLAFPGQTSGNLIRSKQSEREREIMDGIIERILFLYIATRACDIFFHK